MTVKEKELVLKRVFNAPRERVWKAWTDPRRLAQWWGPAGFTNPVCEADVRPGDAPSASTCADPTAPSIQ